ncbi:MAG: hydroxymethylbilane synthase [Rhodospirillaceae bacterium]|nr:hydroxymethylbilane synthase [Rhodospirillaceae bacterium]
MTLNSEQRGVLRIGTRGSRLALIQADSVRSALLAAHPEWRAPGAIEIVEIRTTGDREQDRRLADIGGKGLFTKEIEDALADRRIDMAVHSMKDVETYLRPGMAIAALLPREDPRDVLIAKTASSISELPRGAVLGTASLRRQSQVLAQRPDLKVRLLRGNVETRLAKLADGQADATLLALAGLKRLGLDPLPGTPLSADDILPAPGQGAIGIEIRADDADLEALLAAVDHAPTRLAVEAERACLAALDGSCRTPIAVYAEPADIGGDRWRIRALLALPDGSEIHRIEDHADAAAAVMMGAELGRRLKAKVGAAFLARLETS